MATSKFYKRLRGAVQESEKQLEPFRAKRLEFLRAFVGKNYSQIGFSDKMPVNMMYMAISVYSKYLTPKNVRCLATTHSPELKPTAADLSLAIDHLSKEINLDATFATWIKDALFGLSIIKVGMVPKQYHGNDGFLHDGGQPYADPVSLDDWVHDITARRYEQVGFAGNRYRMALQDVRENSLFDRKVREKITGHDSYLHAEGTSQGRAEDLSAERRTFADEYKDTVELIDLWLPAENLIVTLPYHGSDSEVLREVEWRGPECGPYHIMAYNEVPGNIMPMPLAGHIYDLNDIYNKIYRKLSRQSERQKTIGAAAGDEADVKRLVEASDGQVVKSSSPDAITEISLGGVDQQNFAFAIQMRETLSYLAGNLDSLGGLGSQADTLGQDRLIKASGSQQLQDMIDITQRSISKVIESLGWYAWHNPNIIVPFTKQHSESGIEIPVTWNADSQEGDFFEYNIDIQPYSLQSHSPAERKQLLDQNFMMMLNAAPMMMEQGLMPNFAKYLEMSSMYSNLPELKDLVVYTQGDPDQKQPIQPPSGTQAPGQKNVTERVTHPSSNRAGREHVLANTLFGGNNSPQEQNAASRSYA